MQGDRITTALDRIEAATARLSTSARALGERPHPAQADPELAARHERLRAAVGESLRELDAVLAARDAQG